MNDGGGHTGNERDPSLLAAHQAGAPVELLGAFLADLAAAAAGQAASADALAAYGVSGRQAAMTGVPLRAAVDLYLSAAREAWAGLPAVTEACGVGSLRAVGTDVLGAVDDAVAALCEGYQQAGRAAVRAEEALRREVIDDLLTGTSELAMLLERAPTLGLRLHAGHMVLIVTGSRRFADGRVVVRDLDAALHVQARQFRAEPNLLVATRHGQLVVVLPVDANDGPGLEPALALVRTRLDQEATLTWRGAISRSRTGPTGVRTGFEEARSALELSQRLQRPEQIVWARDLLVYQVIGQEPEQLRELVRTVLLPLAQARGGAGPLLHTVRVYLACGGVAASTARQLHLSVRAVTYRLARLQTLTGRDPGDPEDRFILDVALRGALLLDWPDRPL